MARVTLKSQAIIISQLTAQVAELTTQVGVLMSQLQAAQQDVPHHLQERIATLVDERNKLIAENQRLTEAAVAVTEELDAAKERLAKQGQVIAAQPKSAPPVLPKPAPKPQAPVSDIESVSPVIQITDADREVYRKFNALPREQRLAIIAWARPTFGNVGIDNIQAVRAAWHESVA
jgi:predicted  nucleic acid-binding Zn-ribbon protein